MWALSLELPSLELLGPAWLHPPGPDACAGAGPSAAAGSAKGPSDTDMGGSKQGERSSSFECEVELRGRALSLRFLKGCVALSSLLTALPGPQSGRGGEGEALERGGVPQDRAAIPILTGQQLTSILLEYVACHTLNHVREALAIAHLRGRLVASSELIVDLRGASAGAGAPLDRQEGGKAAVPVPACLTLRAVSNPGNTSLSWVIVVAPEEPAQAAYSQHLGQASVLELTRALLRVQRSYTPQGRSPSGPSGE